MNYPPILGESPPPSKSAHTWVPILRAASLLAVGLGITQPVQAYELNFDFHLAGRWMNSLANWKSASKTLNFQGKQVAKSEASIQSPVSPSPTSQTAELSFDLPPASKAKPTSKQARLKLGKGISNSRLSDQEQAQLFAGGAASLVARAVGSAEGTRTPEGHRTSAYYGHVDPGNGVWNLGSFSYQHGAESPEAADAKQLKRLQNQAITLREKAKAKGIELTLQEELNGIDLANQAPMAALGIDGYIDRLKQAHERGLTGSEAVIWARTQSFISPTTGTWNAPGLGNTAESITYDQERRFRAILKALEAEELQVTIKSEIPLADPVAPRSSAPPTDPVPTPWTETAALPPKQPELSSQTVAPVASPPPQSPPDPEVSASQSRGSSQASVNQSSSNQSSLGQPSLGQPSASPLDAPSVTEQVIFQNVPSEITSGQQLPPSHSPSVTEQVIFQNVPSEIASGQQSPPDPASPAIAEQIIQQDLASTPSLDSNHDFFQNSEGQ
ncbi:MAG: hypothetical protein VKJ46_07595 [Leptolyngbyaceae bacterium]|nr:hypothetical protein [Leptolyngbyaceae bacterium]